MSRLDLLIIGAGPAGMMAALEAVRLGLRAALISEEEGGLVRAARRLDTLAGFPQGISGAAFADRLLAQVRAARAPIFRGQVLRLTSGAEGYEAQLADRAFSARSILLATGTQPAPFHLPLPASPRVHHDLRSLPETLYGERVAVVGGGETALDSALSLSERGAEVSVFLRGFAPRAAPGLVREVMHAAVRLHPDASIRAIESDETAVRVDVEGARAWRGEQVLLAVGRLPRLDLLHALLPNCPPPADIHGPLPGLFLAGDVIRGKNRYVTTALGDAQRAVHACHRYLLHGDSDA